MALYSYKIKAWPYAGKVGIKELNPETNKTEMHLFEHWCYLDTVDSEVDLSETVNTKYCLKFDLDIYRLIGKALNNTHHIVEFNRSDLAFI